MSKTHSGFGETVRKLVRIFLFSLLFLFIAANLFIVLSGRFYLYKGIANTYLKGKSGPGIYDLDVFSYSTIKKADTLYRWIETKTPVQLSAADQKFMAGLSTSSFVVFKGDSIISEHYWGIHHRETVSNSFSAAKTFVALLIGIAIEEGKIKSLDDKVGTYIPEFREGAKAEITIRHLLMMASGLDWEESGKNPLSENAESYYGSDLYRLVTRQKAIEKPGIRFNYQSGNSQLLAFIIEKATGTDLSEYAYRKIWSQIGTDHDAYWSLDKKGGNEKAFCCLYATSRDFGRLGKLILQEGKWEGKQVVPLDYMREIVKNPVMTTDEDIPNFRYGLHIWTYQHEGKDVYYCRGILGQYIISIPADNLVIVRTGLKRMDNYIIPDQYKNDQDFISKNERKVGHPSDLFRYISTAEKMLGTE